MVQATFPRLHAPLALVAGLSMLGGCERGPEPGPAPPAPQTAPAPAAPLAPPALGRADLLQAIAQARSAYAAGTAAGGAQADEPSLAGRSFAVRQAFGCAGPTPPQAGLPGWRWDAGRKSIEIALTPADWTAAPVITGAAGGAGAAWEAVEGFWLSRPWLLEEGCPAPPIRPLSPEGAPAAGVVAAAPVAGLAAVFEAGGSRAGRRGQRAFALTVRGDPTAEYPVGGYRLLLEGRFAAFPDGRAIRCHAAGTETEPVCVAAAQVDRVAFEDAAGRVLREWRAG